MKTEKQIKNAYDRAAAMAHAAVTGSQIVNFAATPAQMASERGAAQCAAGFAAQGLAKLENGDLDGFLTCMGLAGEFAQDARNNFYARTHS